MSTVPASRDLDDLSLNPRSATKNMASSLAMDTRPSTDHVGEAVAHGGYRGVIASLQRATSARVAYGLALVAATEGSTYRKPGAAILVVPGDASTGVLSGGCLEPDLALACERAIIAARPSVAVLDTRGDDDLVFGSGSGCRGCSRVLVLPSTDRACESVARLLQAAAAERAPVRFAVQLTGVHAGAGKCESGVHAQSFGTFELAEAHFTLAPPPRVLLIGVGPEVGPLARACLAMGWEVHLMDHRPARLAPLRASVDRLYESRPTAALLNAGVSSDDAIVILGHSVSLDGEALAAAASSGAGYVGLLGPAARRDELLPRLRADRRMNDSGPN